MNNISKITLTVAQIRDLAKFAEFSPKNSKIEIEWMENLYMEGNSDPEPAGFYVWLPDSPQDSLYGPLG